MQERAIRYRIGCMSTIEKTFWTAFAVIVVGIVGFVIFNGGNVNSERTQALASFAQCLGDNGAKYYGAWWCPNCQQQSALFGAAGKASLPYTECSAPGKQEQLQVCADAGVKAYPTWFFANGEQVEGVQPLAVLAEKTGCELPQIN